MTARFADTFHFPALLDEKDAAHAQSLRFAAAPGGRLVTTDRVLVEVADGL